MNSAIGRQTIYALSSGKLPSGVAIIRLSGPQASAALVKLAGTLPKARQAVLRSLKSDQGLTLDTAVVLWFPGPASFTGEDCAEFHCHGGVAVVAAMLAELGLLDGCRLAEPGEFSLRAFSNGKADLTQIEALGDLIDAQTESQRALAIAGFSSAKRNLYEGWRSELVKARAYLEADLDFSDEEDVPGSVASVATSIVAGLLQRIDAHLATYRAAEIIRDGFRVVIAGAPNAGKSTLLNVLAQRDVAIVTEVAGTTRDVLDVSLNIGGIMVVVSDTAGLRQTTDIVENIGIERAHEAIGRADLVLSLSEDLPDNIGASGLVWRVKSKCDAVLKDDPEFDFCISCHTGHGINHLIEAIGALAAGTVANVAEGEIVSRARHVACLENSRTALRQFSQSIDLGPEFAAEQLRIAAVEIAQITGAISTEDVLGEIFSSFCIGK